MEKKLMDVEKEIGELNSSVRSAHKRIDNLEKIVEMIHELTISVKVMAERMDNMNGAISEIKGNMEEYHHKNPNKLIFNVKNAIITGIVAILVGALMALIIK